MADKEDYMRRVMALLERASHPNTPRAEAEQCQAMADRLMVQHAIDRMDLKPEERGKIIEAEWDFSVSLMGNNSNEYRGNMISLMRSIIIHCNCRLHPNTKYATKEDGTKDHSTYVFKLMGFPEDINYAELIWFRVYKEFVSNVNPQWDGAPEALGMNIYNFQRAGFKWPEIWRFAWRHQEVMRGNRGKALGAPSPAGDILWTYLSPAGRKVEIPDPAVEKTCTVLGSVVRAYCKAQGMEYTRHTQRHEAYKASFATSFMGTMENRLRVRRKEAMEAEGMDTNRAAVALVDTKEQVDAEFYKLYPEFDPEVQKRKREEMNINDWLQAERIWNSLSPEEQEEEVQRILKEEAEAEARWQRESKRARRNFRTVRSSPRDNIDPSAWARGHEAAQRVNLRNDGEVKKANRKELG